MKVALSVRGRFHGYYLANELAKRNVLHELVTSYPRFEVAKYGIPKKQVKGLVRHELLQRAWARIPSSLTPNWNPQFFFHEIYDRHASRVIDLEGVDLFVGFDSNALYTMRVAHERGIPCVVDRGAAHIGFQHRILDEEGDRMNVPLHRTHPSTIERALKEYEEADYIVVLSEFARNSFIEEGIPAEKLIRVNLGVDLVEFEPVERCDDRFRIIHCGRVSLQKGVHYLLEAWRKLALPPSAAELWLVGPIDPDANRFLEQAPPGVIVHGPKKQSELNNYYGQADALCVASLQDGFGMVITQAMAAGIPVIATRNTGGPDVLEEGKTGFIVPIRDVAALEDRILWCYEHREACADMGRAARSSATTDLRGWDAYGEGIYAAYKDILGRRSNDP